LSKNIPHTLSLFTIMLSRNRRRSCQFWSSMDWNYALISIFGQTFVKYIAHFQLCVIIGASLSAF
jgi:hypothetical protein